MRSPQEIQKYLTENWNDYQRFPGTPEFSAFGDAIYLYRRNKLDSFVKALEKNRDRVKSSKIGDKEHKKEVVNFYNQIIDYVKGN